MSREHCFREELDQLHREGLYRRFLPVSSVGDAMVELDGAKTLLFCSNDYLGLSTHPILSQRSMEATARFGTSTGASRLVSGTNLLHVELEEEISRFKGTERALVFNSGYAANTGVISALVSDGDFIFSDRLNHASIIDGSILSRAKLIRYHHNDMDHLRSLLKKHRGKGRGLIVSDGVFSMDGDLPPFADLVALKEEFDLVLMIDDAHGTGVMGEKGRGSSHEAGVADRVDIHMGTFGKALGSFGAYVAASETIVEYLINRSRSFIFSTSLPPAVIGASRAGVELVQSPEGEELRRRLRANRQRLVQQLTDAGFSTTPSTTQIVPIMVGDPHRTMEFARRLLQRGIFLQGIRPPTVPRGTSRLRCTVMAAHTAEQIDRCAAALIQVGGELGVIP
ncbi:MAG: 8-amino-7-oxononanoate synthase [Desulfuromonadia bacterium]